MKISVIIPFYNEEKYIEECLESVVNQSVRPYEVLVVDDGSKDSSKLKVSAFAKAMEDKQNFILLKQKHQGPAIARNLGAKKASGDILVFVDADMKFHKDYLKNLVVSIEMGEAVATFTKEEYVANPEKVWSKCWSINSYLPQNLHIDPNLPDEIDTFRAIKRSVFLKTSGYKNTGYLDDRTVLVQLNSIRAKVAKGAICYHYNPSSLSEIFVSARWIGRGNLTFSLRNLIAFSLPNSLRRGIVETLRSDIPAFMLFKIIFDLGYFLGLLDMRFSMKRYK